jgi:hypothetical protein
VLVARDVAVGDIDDSSGQGVRYAPFTELPSSTATDSTPTAPPRLLTSQPRSSCLGSPALGPLGARVVKRGVHANFITLRQILEANG